MCGASCHCPFAVGLIGQREHGGRVRVVDEFMRQEGVQQRLDRGIGCPRIEQVLALDLNPVFVAERLDPEDLRGATGAVDAPVRGLQHPADVLRQV